MQFEKSECTVNNHTITSDNVLCCAETGRVVAVFYNEYDLDAVIEKLQCEQIKEIERLRNALLNLKEAVEYTPLGLRGLNTVEVARIALST